MTNVQYLSNGYVVSIVEHGSVDSSNGISSVFQTWVTLPVDLSIAGRNRPILIKTTSMLAETVTSSPATFGRFSYALVDGHAVVVTNLTGDGQGADWNYPNSTTYQSMSDDVSSTAYWLALSGAITTGQAYGSAELMYNVQFFELDGVTPVSISQRKNTGKTTNQGNGPKKNLFVP
ncbi:MAG: hypothetical protein ACJ746_13685 [Bryobacteraceae bacterium]